MRTYKWVIVHCSDSDVKAHDGLTTIRVWHIAERGFREVGYQALVFKSEGLTLGRSEASAGAHTKNYNDESLGIMLAGRHEFTDEQFWSAAAHINYWCLKYGIPLESIKPHSYFDKEKTCPNFDVVDEIVSRILSMREFNESQKIKKRK